MNFLPAQSLAISCVAAMTWPLTSWRDQKTTALTSTDTESLIRHERWSGRSQAQTAREFGAWGVDLDECERVGVLVRMFAWAS